MQGGGLDWILVGAAEDNSRHLQGATGGLNVDSVLNDIRESLDSAFRRGAVSVVASTGQRTSLRFRDEGCSI